MFLCLGRRGTALCALLAAAALYFLYFYNLAGVGLLGPDEPRYAAIGREMARSGDFLTPRLGGQPWFEKPPLLYWMTALGFCAGLGEEAAPRLPVAICSVAFLLFFYWILRREFGWRAALFSSAILATLAAWLALSRVAVTDLPMAAAFSAAMLLCLPWIARGERRGLTVAAALLTIAVLAKGLVPLALALPLLFLGWRRWRDWLRPGPVAAFVLVAAPWYVASTVRFGSQFLEDFFWKHHVERFFTPALQHAQPFWFYVPVLAAALFPWTPALILLFRRGLYQDARRKLLLAWVLWGFVFFSAATNKLPGYMLPLAPALAALAGFALAEIKRARLVLVASTLLLAAVPVVAAVLPVALERGITHAYASIYGLVFAPVLALAASVWWADAQGRRGIAMAVIVAAAVAGAVWLERATFPILDRTVSARGLWRQISDRRGEVCIASVSRSWRYNLDYYSDTPLPPCSSVPRPIRIEQPPDGAPAIASGVPPPAR